MSVLALSQRKYRGGQNFTMGAGGGEQKHTVCLKSTKKETIFLEKSQKA